jgi:hypothetical protein
MIAFTQQRNEKLLQSLPVFFCDEPKKYALRILLLHKEWSEESQPP